MAHDARAGSCHAFHAGSLVTWWTNVQPKIQSHRTAWLNHVWVVAEFDLDAKRVKFVRASEGKTTTNPAVVLVLFLHKSPILSVIVDYCIL